MRKAILLGVAAVLAAMVCGCAGMTQEERVALFQQVSAEAFRWFQAYQAGTAAVATDDAGLAEAQKDAFAAANMQGAYVLLTQPQGTPPKVAFAAALKQAQQVCDGRGKAYWYQQGLTDNPPGFDYFELAQLALGGDLGKVEEADQIEVFMSILQAYQAQLVVDAPIEPGTAAPPLAPAAP